MRQAVLKKYITPLELVSVPGHTFLILGRNPETSIHDPETWNEEIVICDPWRRKYKAGSGVLHEESMIYSPKKLVEKFQKKSIPLEDLTIAFAIYAALENTTPLKQAFKPE